MGIASLLDGFLREFSPFCPVYDGGVRILPTHRRRAVCGLVVLVILSAVVVPLYLSCVVIASESDITHEMYVRMRDARDALLWVSLLLQFGAGWLLHSGFPIQTALPARLLKFTGLWLTCAVGSFICGFVISDLAEHGWYNLARRLFL
jgi:hypothetical protein